MEHSCSRRSTVHTNEGALVLETRPYVLLIAQHVAIMHAGEDPFMIKKEQEYYAVPHHAQMEDQRTWKKETCFVLEFNYLFLIIVGYFRSG